MCHLCNRITGFFIFLIKGGYGRKVTPGYGTANCFFGTGKYCSSETKKQVII